MEHLVEIIGVAVRQSWRRTALVHDARHDPLTGLINHTPLLDHLEPMIESGDNAAALLIDLDGFKAVNDDHGHRVGDCVLAQVARRLERSVGIADVRGRLGGTSSWS
ncbi:MAG: GGDEF domain-containing protein [Ilumatobacteraceae bacterium]